MAGRKYALSMHIDSEETVIDVPTIDLNNKHVIPILWTALLQSNDLLFLKDKFEFVHLNSHLYGELLADSGYHELVEFLDGYVYNGELLPLFLIYNPVENTRHIVYRQLDLTGMFNSNVKPFVVAAKIIRYGKTSSELLYLPLLFRNNRVSITLMPGDDVFKIRGKLMNAFFKYAPFGLYPFPSSFDTSKFGLKKRPEISFTKEGRIKTELDKRLDAAMRRAGLKPD